MISEKHAKMALPGNYKTHNHKVIQGGGAKSTICFFSETEIEIPDLCALRMRSEWVCIWGRGHLIN